VTTWPVESRVVQSIQFENVNSSPKGLKILSKLNSTDLDPDGHYMV
jgi:hypothetical protein